MVFHAGSTNGEVPAETQVIEQFDIANDGSTVLVPVTVAGTKRLFAVDTGTSYVLYDNLFRDSLRSSAQVGIGNTLSGRIQVPLFQAPAAFLGHLDLRGPVPANAASVGCIDLGGMRGATGEDVRGIIGCPFLRKYVVRLDVERGKLSFLRQIGADPGVRVPMECVEGVPAILASVEGIGHTLFMLDTGYVGASGGLDIATVKKIEALHLLTELPGCDAVDVGGDEPRTRRLNRIRSITVGGFTHHGIVFAEEAGGQPICTLGLAYLSRYIVTFDFPGGALYLKPAKKFSVPDNTDLSGGERVGISIGRAGAAVVAADVFPESPAKKAGVEVGDLLLSVDGKDIRRSRLFSIEKMFLSCSARAQLTVQRGDRKLSLTLSLPPSPLDGTPLSKPLISKWGLKSKWGQSELFPDNARPQASSLSTTDGSPPPSQKPHDDTFTNSLGMRFTLIPAGEFMMGSDESVADIERALGELCNKPEWIAAEHPKHCVRIRRPFYLGIYEVTREQFGRFVEAEGYRTDAEKDGQGGHGWSQHEKAFAHKTEYNWRYWGVEQGDASPVVNVSWNDAVAFCQWLSRTEGKRYRLPTEAEWEYACRAGTNTRFHSGNDPERLTEIGNVADGTARQTFTWWHTVTAKDGFTFPCEGGRFRPNLFGLFDMTGNVGEWCADWYGADYYANSPLDDPPGPAHGSLRMIRGGGWSEFLICCRTAFRRGVPPTKRYDYVGFRVACDAP